MRVAVALCGCVALVAPGARAQTVPSATPVAIAGSEPFPARVRVSLPRCEAAPFDAEAFVALLRVELVGDGVRRVDVVSADPASGGESAGGSLADIAIDPGEGCAQGAPLAVQIDDAATRKQVRRVVDVGDVPERARPRALALAVAELLRASWAELAMPDVPLPVRPVPDAVRIAASERALSARPAAYATGPARAVGLALDLRLFPVFQDGSSVLAGARISGEFSLGASASVALRFDAGAAGGTVGDPLGQVTVGMLTAGVAGLLTGGTDSLRLGFGPRVEAGLGWVSGNAAGAGISAAGGVAPLVLASVLGVARLRLHPRVWAMVDLEVGATALGLVADAGGRRAAGAAGPMVGLRLGVAAGL